MALVVMRARARFAEGKAIPAGYDQGLIWPRRPRTAPGRDPAVPYTVRTTSRTLSTRMGIGGQPNVSCRCGFRPNACQMRCTVAGDTPALGSSGARSSAWRCPACFGEPCPRCAEPAHRHTARAACARRIGQTRAVRLVAPPPFGDGLHRVPKRWAIMVPDSPSAQPSTMRMRSISSSGALRTRNRALSSGALGVGDLQLRGGASSVGHRRSLLCGSYFDLQSQNNSNYF